jgi:hypothetical protein
LKLYLLEDLFFIFKLNIFYYLIAKLKESIHTFRTENTRLTLTYLAIHATGYTFIIYFIILFRALIYTLLEIKINL